MSMTREETKEVIRSMATDLGTHHWRREGVALKIADVDGEARLVEADDVTDSNIDVLSPHGAFARAIPHGRTETEVAAAIARYIGPEIFTASDLTGALGRLGRDECLAVLGRAGAG